MLLPADTDRHDFACPRPRAFSAAVTAFTVAERQVSGCCSWRLPEVPESSRIWQPPAPRHAAGDVNNEGLGGLRSGINSDGQGCVRP